MLSAPAAAKIMIHLYGLLAAARRWHDPVHTQILDHLPVVIEAMSRGKRCQEEASSRPATTANLQATYNAVTLLISCIISCL